MTLPVSFLAAAQRELQDAAEWYELQRPGLGVLFITEVERALTMIGQFPHAAATAHADLRCARVQRFPYSVVYRVDSDRLLVFAVFHARRDPMNWRNRTTDRQ